MIFFHVAFACVVISLIRYYAMVWQGFAKIQTSFPYVSLFVSPWLSLSLWHSHNVSTNLSYFLGSSSICDLDTLALSYHQAIIAVLSEIFLALQASPTLRHFLLLHYTSNFSWCAPNTIGVLLLQSCSVLHNSHALTLIHIKPQIIPSLSRNPFSSMDSNNSTTLTAISISTLTSHSPCSPSHLIIHFPIPLPFPISPCNAFPLLLIIFLLYCLPFIPLPSLQTHLSTSDTSSPVVSFDVYYYTILLNLILVISARCLYLSIQVTLTSSCFTYVSPLVSHTPLPSSLFSHPQ